MLHRLKVPVLSCHCRTGISGSRTWLGTPAWAESPRGPLCWLRRRLSSGLWRRQRGPYSVRCTSLAPCLQRRSWWWCCSSDRIHSGLLAGFPPRFWWWGCWRWPEPGSSQWQAGERCPIVAAVSLTAPVLEQADECGTPKFFRHILFFPDAGEEWVECFEGHWTGWLKDLCRNPVHPWGFSWAGLPDCLRNFVNRWGEVYASDYGLLWDLVEHSGGSVEQGTEVFPPPVLMLLFSLSRVEPSADRSGVVCGLVRP